MNRLIAELIIVKKVSDMADSSSVNVTYVYLFSPTFQFMNISGKPLADGYIEVYISGTRSKYYAWSDFDGTLHPFKIPLNALGSAVVLVSPAHSYDVYVYNSLGVLQMSRYNITPATGEGTVITDVTTITSRDETVEITANSSTEYDLSVARALQNTADSVLASANGYTDSALASGLSDKKDKQTALEFRGSATKTVKKIAQNADGVMSVEFEDIDLSNKKDKQSALEFSGSATKTIKKITQNDNGVMSVEFEDIDLPQEVPNVNVTSTDSSITVTSSIDPDTNTKTFDLSVANEAEVEYGRFIASDVTATATLIKTRGNLELSNNKIQLKKDTLYHFTVRGSYVATTLSNTLSTLNFIEYSTFNGIHVNVDNSIPDTQFFEFSYDVKTNSDMAYIVSFSSILNAKVASLEIDVHSVVAGSISGESEISTGKGLYLTSDGKLTTEEPEENFIDITDEWEFDNGFRLQYNGQFPGEGNDMRILYSPVSDIVKFTSACRINRPSPIITNDWNVMIRYIGNRFYTTNNTTNPEHYPKIYNGDPIGGVTLVIGTNAGGGTSNSLLKFGYVGTESSTVSETGLAISQFINPDNTSIYGTLLSGLKLKVTKKV